ncbi:hypothetical protein BKA67DRAFT_674717 [Truncatella angustata]|uniref:Uncharacterized protein n=1 Tax=Truncatella angustata TaxID=152316 RepID=A0A9P8UUL1_9PEZI|nr:uncharacterized protein BKA67DRAFT_674717 [Truncatella angustata]KAH6658633.1 hypothetical protein BKA67DRAFT_674717 [Truncatella angustata]
MIWYVRPIHSHVILTKIATELSKTYSCALETSLKVRLWRGSGLSAKFKSLESTFLSPRTTQLDAVLDDGISYVQTSEVTAIEHVPSELFEEPARNETWTNCLILIHDFEAFRAIFDETPQLHIVGITGRRHHSEKYVVAICNGCLAWLDRINFPLLRVSDHHWNPSQREIDVYGASDAAKRAQQRFLQHVTGVVYSATHVKSLYQYYENNIYNDSLRAAVRWPFFRRDFQNSRAGVRRRFLQYCVFVALHSLEDLKHANDHEMVGRDQESWSRFFERLCMRRSEQLALDPLAEMQTVSLLQGILEAASDEISHPAPTFDTRYSAKQNIEMICTLLDCDMESGLASIGNIEEEILTQTLLRCTIFAGLDKIDVMGFKEQMCMYVPIGYPDVDGLPAHLVQTISHDTVNATRANISYIYRLAPSLQKPENDMLVVLCFCSLSDTVDPAISEWVNSSEGTKFYHRTIGGCQNKEAFGQMCLRILALLSFQKMLSCRIHTTSEPTHSSYLYDFCKLLDGETLNNTQTVMERMALSLKRRMDKENSDGIRDLFRAVTEVPLHICDGQSDEYWTCRLEWESYHQDALHATMASVQMIQVQMEE